MEKKSTLCNENIANISDLPRETYRVFDILGTYLANTYYNGLVNTAKEYHAKGSRQTLTECYRLAITNYLVAFKSSENANKILQDYYNYYSRCGDNLSFEECSLLIVKVCIPDEIFKHMGSQVRVTALMKIWVDTIQNITDLIYRYYISRILDDRSQIIRDECIKNLRDEIINILALGRDEIIADIYSSSRRKGEKISKTASQRMKDTIHKLSAEKEQMQAEAEQMKQIIRKQYKQMKKIKEAYGNLEAQYKTVAAVLRQRERSMGLTPTETTQQTVQVEQMRPYKEKKSKSRSKNVVSRDYTSVNDYAADLQRIDTPAMPVRPVENKEDDSDVESATSEESVARPNITAKIDTSLLSDIKQLTEVRKPSAPEIKHVVGDDIPKIDMY